MQENIDRVLIPREKIARRVRELARQITADHTPPKVQPGQEITIVPILSGAMIFCADLIREIPIPMKIGLLTVSSYPGKSVRSQGAQFIQRALEDVKGRHVVLVDDILDSGNTMNLVAPLVRDLGAASLRTCVLLRKERSQIHRMRVDYVGFDIPDEFVVGYGLDFDNYYRNLPDIVILKKQVLEARS